jgi:hypothetical protein
VQENSTAPGSDRVPRTVRTPRLASSITMAAVITKDVESMLRSSAVSNFPEETHDESTGMS